MRRPFFTSTSSFHIDFIMEKRCSQGLELNWRHWAYPNRSHSISEGPNTRRHLFTLLTRYLQEHLPAGPREK